jgi:small GTP-binding protein
MLRTAISGIDEMLGSGIPNESKVLFSMEPGVDGGLFMPTTLVDALSRGSSCLVIIPTSTKDAFKEEILSTKGIDIYSLPGKIITLDSRTREHIRKNTRERSERLTEWKRLIRSACSEQQIDAIFVYFDLLYEDFGLDDALTILEMPGDSPKPVIIVEHLNLEGDTFIEDIISRGLFDLVFSIKAAYTGVPFFNFLTIEYISWSKMPRRSVPYQVSDGGIRLYIPKIIVTGPPGSGKSTMVNNACEYGLSVDRPDLTGSSTTVAMDLGWLHLKGFDISIYGTPGKPRFDPILPQLFKSAMGAILVIDVTRLETFDRARQLLDIIQHSLLPVVVVANKSDLPHSLGEDGIRKILDLPDDTHIFFISAMRSSDVCEVVEALVEQILLYPY